MSGAGKRRSRSTPLRAALRDESTLQAEIQDGLGALERPHRGMLDDVVKGTIADSLDLDEAMRPGRDRDNRWDYLLGHGPSGAVVALEPHSAHDKEVSVVIAKKQAARDQLRQHLESDRWVEKWLWVASGNVGFSPTGKAIRRLDQRGIEFVGRKVLAKHLKDL